MAGIKLGQYVHGNSPLHLLDPRTKIICCLIILISVLINFNWYYLLFYFLLMLMAIRFAGMPFSFALGSIKSIRFLLLVTFLFQAVLVPGEPVIELGVMKVTREGLTLGMINLLRLLILYLGSLVLLMTTSPLKLSAGIDFLLLPLSKIKIPVHNFTTILSISFRFIPTLVEEATIIKNAQSSRGAQFYSPNLVARLKSYLAILIPLFESSLARAEELGEAMDSRCYTAHPNQIRMSRMALNRKDIAVLCFMVVVLAAGVIIPVIARGTYYG